MNPRWRRALQIGGVVVIVSGAVLLGLFHHAPRATHTAIAPPPLFLSPPNRGRAALPKNPNETNIFGGNGPAHSASRESGPRRGTGQARSSAAPPPANPTATAPAEAANAASLPDLAGRFPALAHQVIASVPEGGSEPAYFARLGNLLNGTPMPAGTAQTPATVDHLAHAQADLDRGDLKGAVAEVRSISGAAADVMHPWLEEAEARLAQAGQPARAATRIARNTSPPRAWPNVMPNEIPPAARESTDPGSL